MTASPLHLNLGCGDQYAPGWVNVDHGSPHPKDLDVDLTGELPWMAGSIDRIYAGHVLEHLTIAQCCSLLERLHDLTHMAGEIMVVGPDVERAQAMVDVGTLLDITMGELRDGGNRWSGDAHHWHCTPMKIAAMLTETGWCNITEIPISEVPPEWPVAYRGPQWQCAVHATRS